jgi:CRISPR-associated protein Cmr4
MIKKELTSIVTFSAISPIHAGSGLSTGAVDIPIQRERHTGWPVIQASAVKGAFRAHCRNSSGDLKLLNLVFGSDDQDNWKMYKEKTYAHIDKNKQPDGLAGAISISDAKLLFFPVRSNVAPFVYITSPAILQRFYNDLKYVGMQDEDLLITVEQEQAVSLTGDQKGKNIVLEDALVQTSEDSRNIPVLSEFFPNMKRLILVSDEMFDYCVSACTEVQAQIKIDAETGATQNGSLRYEELLPSDSVLYSITNFSAQVGENLKAQAVKAFVQNQINTFIQIGGDETLGRGICQVSWHESRNGGDA